MNSSLFCNPHFFGALYGVVSFVWCFVTRYMWLKRIVTPMDGTVVLLPIFGAIFLIGPIATPCNWQAAEASRFADLSLLPYLILVIVVHLIPRIREELKK